VSVLICECWLIVMLTGMQQGSWLLYSCQSS